MYQKLKNKSFNKETDLVMEVLVERMEKELGRALTHAQYTLLENQFLQYVSLKNDTPKCRRKVKPKNSRKPDGVDFHWQRPAPFRRSTSG